MGCTLHFFSCYDTISAIHGEIFNRIFLGSKIIILSVPKIFKNYWLRIFSFFSYCARDVTFWFSFSKM